MSKFDWHLVNSIIFLALGLVVSIDSQSALAESIETNSIPSPLLGGYGEEELVNSPHATNLLTQVTSTSQLSDAQPTESNQPNTELSPQLNQYSSEGLDSLHSDSEELAQVTSVSQLSDVQPTDWAFQALQSLVERYGAIAGYPDGTFRSNRAMTRYEFAAALNVALNRINELMAAGNSNLVKKEDLLTLQKLQEEFATELTTLRTRVDALEARTFELEATQFSTTTKLTGEAILAVTGGTSGNRDIRNSNTTPGVSPSGDF